jgi:hypothetical protein
VCAIELTAAVNNRDNTDKRHEDLTKLFFGDNFWLTTNEDGFSVRPMAKSSVTSTVERM